MAQPLITQFYNKRKRPAEGFSADCKSKVLVLDGEVNLSRNEYSTNLLGAELSDKTRKITYQVKKVEPAKEDGRVSDINPSKLKLGVLSKSTSEMSKKIFSKTRKVVPQTSKSDIRLAFKPKVLNTCDTTENGSRPVPELKNDNNNADRGIESKNNSSSGNKIIFELLSGLSPKKKGEKDLTSPIKSDSANENHAAVKSERRELGLITPKKIKEQKSKATLDEIRNKLNSSKDIAKIRESIKKFSKNDQLLKNSELQRKKLECTSPRLKKFAAIDLEVPVSPQKSSVSSLLNSPHKQSPLKRTPIKSPLTSPVKIPAYQRFSSLVEPGVPSLVLPYSYRMLAEIFRCMDTVTSMMYNRKETVTFDKLKSGVQQMLRRNFTEHQVGQIKRVLPDAFKFSQEKMSTIISSKKGTKYQLVILPLIDSEKPDVQRIKNGCFHSMMTPSLLVERRECFYKNLLEIVKDHHEEFLKQLDPPYHIARANLTRWHPGFDLERVPPVVPADLPPAPTEEKVCSAQDVLDRAKSLFGINQRMEKALQLVSEQMSRSKEIIASQGTSNENVSNSPLLKGIPQALLEKVRAKQAAKALVAMTRTPEEDREAVQLLRLPEIARILRNIFVTEKKNVLHLEIALEKLSNSYREALSSGELEKHIRLLMKVVPGWMEILHVRKADYLRVAKDADISLVIKKLEKLAAEKNANL